MSDLSLLAKCLDDEVSRKGPGGTLTQAVRENFDRIEAARKRLSWVEVARAFAAAGREVSPSILSQTFYIVRNERAGRGRGKAKAKG